ncbi:MAG: hypothetical protein NTW91_00240 [Verrucomicrobia bacterium]|nr:hypothetical protein [Verrucomicrobiota bacterium]
MRFSHLGGCWSFSLIELLVVLNIALYFFWLAVPSFNSITQAYGVTEAAYNVSSAVERARSEAVARKTYVWLGVQQVVKEGTQGLSVGMVCSKDGAANTNVANLLPLGKPLLIQRVGLVPSTTVTTGAPTGGAVDLEGFMGGVIFQIGKTLFQDGRTITFMPLGEATTNPVPTPSSGFDHLMLLTFRQARGDRLIPGNDVTVAIDGSVGLPVIYRK